METILVGKKEYHDIVMEKGAGYIQKLINEGHKVVQLTMYQYRIDDRLDVYPRNKRWHDLQTGRRGSYRNQQLNKFVTNHLKGAA